MTKQLLVRHTYSAQSLAGLVLREAYEDHEAEVAEAPGGRTGQGFFIRGRISIEKLLARNTTRGDIVAAPLLIRSACRGDEGGGDEGGGAEGRIGFGLLFSDRSLLVAEATLHPEHLEQGAAAPFTTLRLHPIVQRLGSIESALMRARDRAAEPASLAGMSLNPSKTAPGHLRAGPGKETLFEIDARFLPLSSIAAGLDYPSWRGVLNQVAVEIDGLLTAARGWRTPLHPMDGGRPETDWQPYMPWMNASEHAMTAIVTRLQAVAVLARVAFVEGGVPADKTSSRTKLVFGDGRGAGTLIAASHSYAPLTLQASVSALARDWFFSGAWSGLVACGRKVSLHGGLNDAVRPSGGLMSVEHLVPKDAPEASAHARIAALRLLASQDCPPLSTPWVASR